MNNSPDISVNTIYSRPVLPCSEEPQRLYVLLSMICTADIKQAPSLPLHLCLVVDSSTSMTGDRINMVKANVIELLGQLKNSDIFSMVTFSDRAKVILPPTAAADLGKLKQRIGQINTTGGTEIFQGLELGITQLRGYMAQAETIPHLILLTDGHTYGDEERSFALVKEAAQEGIIVSALGIGSEWNDVFLDKLTGLTGGSTMFVKSPEQVQNFLASRFGPQGITYARKISLVFPTKQTIHPNQIFRILPDPGPLSIESPVLLGNLLYDNKIIICLEFIIQSIPETINNIQVMKGSITMDLVGQKEKDGTLEWEIELPVAQNPDRMPVPEVLFEAISRLSLYRLQEKAREEVNEGKPEQAGPRLQRLASHLLAQGNSQLAAKVLSEASIIQGTHHFSEGGDKAVKYGTRSLFLPSPMEMKG